MSDQKTVMLGIDAGDLAFIEANLAQLPNFRRLFDLGVLRRLRTTSELLTGSVWPTFYTGSLPGEHGIYHHLQWDPASMRIRRVAEDWLYSEPFWYAMARHGAKVTVVDVPMVFPSRLRSGTEVVNWGSHDQLGPFHTNDDQTSKSISQEFGEHPMGPEIPVSKSAPQLDQIRRNLIAGAAKKGELIQSLLRSTDWDFFLAVFGETHRGGHILWPDRDPGSVVPRNALLEVYRAVDGALEGILEAIDLASTRLVLFSIHGMQENMSQEHFVAPVMGGINSAFYDEENQGGHQPRQRSLMRWLRDSLPAPLQNAVAQMVPVQVRDWVVSRATSGGYDWPQTSGFALLADYNGYIRYNIVGREAQGCLNAEDSRFHRYTESVRRGFQELRLADTGLPLVHDLVDAQAVFPGARQDVLPDLVVTWAQHEPATRIESSRLGAFKAQIATGRSGNHRHEGFAVVLEPEGSDSAGQWDGVAHIADLAPAILRIHAVA